MKNEQNSGNSSGSVSHPRIRRCYGLPVGATHRKDGGPECGDERRGCVGADGRHARQPCDRIDDIRQPRGHSRFRQGRVWRYGAHRRARSAQTSKCRRAAAAAGGDCARAHTRYGVFAAKEAPRAIRGLHQRAPPVASGTPVASGNCGRRHTVSVLANQSKKFCLEVAKSSAICD